MSAIQLDPSPLQNDLNGVMQRAREQQCAWGAKSLEERAEILRSLARYILEHEKEIAETITRSTGKPICESISSEWLPVINMATYYANEGPKILADESLSLPLVMRAAGRSSKVEHRPVGVVGIISPWNYPFAIPMGDIAAATMAGNSVVLKPSEFTPEVGNLIARICEAVDLPVTVVQGGGELGVALIDAKPNKIVFTGGPATGRKVMEAASKHLIPVVMELGGKDPMVVLSDANLDNAAKAAVWACFTNLGQVCCSVKRVYVEESVADAFIDKVKAEVEALRVGDPMSPHTDIGHMIHEQQVALARAAIERAVEQGATILCGGTAPEDIDDPRYFLPTVLVDVQQDMDVVQQEIFGPVLPIIRVSDEDEAIHLANDSQFGLGASVFSQYRGSGVAEKLKAGMVTVNDATYAYSIPEAPFGGIGESGFGRIHGKWGLLDFVNVVHVNTNNRPKDVDPWWFPYGPELSKMIEKVAQHSVANSLPAKVGTLLSAGMAQKAREKEMAGHQK